jgi:uncharacterized protein YndB with AHSA1/START domain
MDLRYVFYINAPPERVWRALCDGQPIAAGMPGVELRSTFEPGSEYAYVGRQPDGSEVSYVYGTVLASEPNRRMEMTYRTGDQPHESRVVYALEPVANRYTKLTATQDGFQPGDPNYEQNLDGWPKLLSNLKSFIETGQVMNYYAEG